MRSIPRGIGLWVESISPAQWAETYAETYRQLETLITAGSGLIYDPSTPLPELPALIRP